MTIAKTSAEPQRMAAPIPLARFRDEVLEGFRSKSGNAVYSMRKVFNVVESLGVATTSDLAPTLLDRFAHELEGMKIGKRAFYWLKFACGIAVDRGYLDISPFTSRPELDAATRNVFPVRRQPRRLTPAQFRTIKTYLEERAGESILANRLYVLVCVIASTGLSFHEAVRLRVSDVDFESETIRRPLIDGRVRRGPQEIPMAPELAVILRSWLQSRNLPVGPRCKLDEAKVAEIRRRKEQGESTKSLAELYGVSRYTIWEAATGRTWQRTPGMPEAVTPVAESDFVFPKLTPGAAGPWTRLDNLEGGDSGRLKAAARAAGVDRLKINELKFVNKFYYSGALAAVSILLPRAANDPANLGHPVMPPPAGRVPLVVKLPDRSYLVCGKPKTLGTKIQRKLVDFLIEGGVSGRGSRELRTISTDYCNVLGRIRRDGDWIAGILEASGPGRKDHWRIAYVDSDALKR